MKAKWDVYKELELISDSMWDDALRDANLPRFNYKSWLHKVCTFVVDILTRNPEPKIFEKYDCNGNPYWYVYDPATGASAAFNSKAEILTWLESRYYSRDRF